MRGKLDKGIKIIKGSKDAKVLLTNFGYLSFLQIASYVFPLITLPYLARVIGVDSFGKIAFAAAVIIWFKTVTDWGFNFTATRDVAKIRDDKEKVSEIFSNVLWSRLLLMLTSFVILLLLIFFIPKFRENQVILLVSFLTIPGSIMFPDWLFQAMERMKYTTMLNLVSQALFTASIFIFIKTKSDFILQPLLTSLGFLVSGSVAMYIIIFKWGIKVRFTSFHKIFKTIAGSTDIFINNLMPNLYNSFSILLLGFWGGIVSNGIFDAGSKFVTISQQFMNIITRTFFPFLSRKIDKHKIFMKINLYFAIAFSIMLFFAAPLLIKLFFTVEFYDAIIVLQIMSISILFMSLTNTYGTNYMIIQGREKQLRNITFMSSIIGFLISFPLIYYFNYIGAAITVCLTRGILGISIMLKARAIKQIIEQADPST